VERDVISSRLRVSIRHARSKRILNEAFCSTRHATSLLSLSVFLSLCVSLSLFAPALEHQKSARIPNQSGSSAFPRSVVILREINEIDGSQRDG